MITIDGSKGEGGGQILRTSLSLAMITGKPCTIEHIRAGRRKPGLMRQHLTAVNAAAQICEAQVTGAEVGSMELTFSPNAIRGGEYAFSVGTAGSVTLVFQTILPALMIAEQESSLILTGGTHNPMAPPFPFLEKVFLPIINQMGPQIEVQLKQYGFYPAGGGQFQCMIKPAKTLIPFSLLQRGMQRSRNAEILLSNLSEKIGKRERDVILHKLNWSEDQVRIQSVPSKGPGNTVSLLAEYEGITELFTGFGEMKKTAEMVAMDVVREYMEYIKNEYLVGPYLADQLILPMVLAGGGEFYTGRLTHHARTQVELIQQFLGIDFSIETHEKGVVIRKGSGEWTVGNG